VLLWLALIQAQPHPADTTPAVTTDAAAAITQRQQKTWNTTKASLKVNKMMQIQT
jgi:hypothetical protein